MRGNITSHCTCNVIFSRYICFSQLIIYRICPQFLRLKRYAYRCLYCVFIILLGFGGLFSLPKAYVKLFVMAYLPPSSTNAVASICYGHLSCPKGTLSKIKENNIYRHKSVVYSSVFEATRDNLKASNIADIFA